MEGGTGEERAKRERSFDFVRACMCWAKIGGVGVYRDPIKDKGFADLCHVVHCRIREDLPSVRSHFSLLFMLLLGSVQM